MQEFITTYINQPIDVDKAFGNQCWDLGAAYCRDVINCPPPYLPTGSNLGVITSFIEMPGFLNNYFDKIENNPQDLSQIPQAGDLVFFDSTYGNGLGHISLCVSADRNGFVGFEQNNPIGSPAHEVNHFYEHILGWLRKKEVNMDELTKATQIANERLDALNVKDQEIAAYTLKTQELTDLAEARLKDITTLQTELDDANSKAKPTVVQQAAQYNKTWIAIAGFIITGLTIRFGASNPYIQLLVMAATTLGVYAVPNKAL